MSCVRLLSAIVVCLSLTASLAATATAQELGVRSYGLRGGINVNPDQFAFGGHIDAGRLTDNIRFQPSAEIGFGNGVMLASTHFDAHYLLAPRGFRPYVGGGFGLNFVDVRSGIGSNKGLGIEPVVSFVGGIEWGADRPGEQGFRRYLMELRLGFGDTPELQITAGINF